MEVTPVNPLPNDIYLVYRMVAPAQFEKTTGKPRPVAFHIREHETALSVWAADRVAPRDILQKALDTMLSDLASTDEAKRRKAENRRASNGATPEEMYDRGWRVARLKTSDFVALGLPVSPPRLADGHCDVEGTQQDFEESAIALVECAVVLTRDETLPPAGTL